LIVRGCPITSFVVEGETQIAFGDKGYGT
jgi:hypothetical protein